eukprot:83875-Amorphochlora_amoeboformis.AAC.1
MDVTDVQPETKAQFEAEEEIVKERDERLPSTVDRGNGRPFKRGKIAVWKCRGQLSRGMRGGGEAGERWREELTKEESEREERKGGRERDM